MGKPQSAHFVASSLFVTFPLFVGGIHLVLAASRDSPSCLDGRYVIKRHWMAVRTGHGILMVKAVIYWQIRGRECRGEEHTHLNPRGLFTRDTGCRIRDMGYGMQNTGTDLRMSMLGYRTYTPQPSSTFCRLSPCFKLCVLALMLCLTIISALS